MTMTLAFKNFCFMLCTAAPLAACANTTYKSYDEPAGSAPFVREVMVDNSPALVREFYRDPPDCVTVLATLGKVSPRIANLVERSTARHLTEKIARVVGPKKRRRLEKKLVLDLNHSGDRRFYAASQNCRFFATPAVTNFDSTYIVFWASRSIEIEVTITRGADGPTIWRTKTKAFRGDGGLPISPFSIVAAAFDAGRARGDGDNLPSMIDDAIRRMTVKLPDLNS